MAQSKEELDSRKVWYWTGGMTAAAIVLVVILWATGVMSPEPVQ